MRKSIAALLVACACALATPTVSHEKYVDTGKGKTIVVNCPVSKDSFDALVLDLQNLRKELKVSPDQQQEGNQCLTAEEFREGRTYLSNKMATQLGVIHHKVDPLPGWRLDFFVEWVMDWWPTSLGWLIAFLMLFPLIGLWWVVIWLVTRPFKKGRHHEDEV